MIEFGKREAGAAAAIVGVLVVGGAGWLIQHQRQEAQASDLKPTFADGTPAKTAGPDGTANAAEIPTDAPEESPAASPSPEASLSPKKSDEIVVFVSGAVKRPGVYTFKPGDRIYNAVRAAGGFKANAQQDALNQAETLRDADQIYIPPRGKATTGGNVSVAADTGGTARMRAEMFRTTGSRRVSLPPPTVTVRPLIIEGTTPSTAKDGSPTATAEPLRERGRVLGKPPVAALTVAAQTSEPAPIDSSVSDPPAGADPITTAEPTKSSGHSRSGSGGGASPKFKNPGDGIVNINTAGPEELQKLPGVGPSTAQKFIDYRTQIGRFASVDQVQDIKGIGPKKFAKLRPFITL